MSTLAIVSSIAGVLLAAAALSWWFWRTPYVPPPNVHRDYTRPGDPPESKWGETKQDEQDLTQ